MFCVPSDVCSRVKTLLDVMSTVWTINGVDRHSTKPIITTFAWRWSVFSFINAFNGNRSATLLYIERQNSQIMLAKMEERNTSNSIMDQNVKSSALWSSKHKPMISSSKIQRLLTCSMTTRVKQRANMLSSDISTWLLALSRWTVTTTIKLSMCCIMSIKYKISALSL